MKITDVHCHIYPKKISEKASRGIGVFYDIGMQFEGSTDHLLEVGKANGIEKFWVFSAATARMGIFFSCSVTPTASTM